MKFGTLQQMLNPIAVTWPKIESFKIQDGGDGHLENRFFCRNSLTDCPISAKFCVRKQNRMPTKATWKKTAFFKIQDCGRPPFWKSLYRHISVKIFRFKWNLVHYIRYWTRLRSRDQKLKFLKFDMATAAILKSLFWPLLINRLSDIRDILHQEAERHADKGRMIKTANFQNPRWRTVAILKIVKSPYLSETIIGFWQTFDSIYWTWWAFQKRYRSRPILDVIR